MNLFTQLMTHFRLAETETEFTAGARMASAEGRDRLPYDREEGLRQALEAWRVNPLARRIVGLTTQYVVGGGLRISSKDAATHHFLDEWWTHHLNGLSMRVWEWCDELSRSGELFLLLSTGADGMSYVRAVPALDIQEIETAERDLQQEVAYIQKAAPGEDPIRWPAYRPAEDARLADGRLATVMLHYAINRPVGAVHGESDLAPLLRWLSRYAAWLEDRARLNRYRNSFLFVVKARFHSEAERLARQSALAGSPPAPGSILVVDENERWECLNPQLHSQDAGEDGLALKKMIAAGAGLPLHFLAEPEGSNRSTAESAGGPTYRHFEQRQEFFCRLIEDVARVVVQRKAFLVPRSVDPTAPIRVQGADLSARDNASLAVATSTITAALLDLRRAGLIDDAELLRMVYRFAGEVVDVEGLLEEAKTAPPTPLPGEVRSPRRPAGVKIDPLTGEATGTAAIR